MVPVGLHSILSLQSGKNCRLPRCEKAHRRQAKWEIHNLGLQPGEFPPGLKPKVSESKDFEPKNKLSLTPMGKSGESLCYKQGSPSGLKEVFSGTQTSSNGLHIGYTFYFVLIKTSLIIG